MFHAVPCLGAFKVQLKNGLLWEAIPNHLLRTALDLDTSLPCSSPLYHCYYHSGMYRVWTCPSPLPEYKPTKGRDFILLYFPSLMASQCLQHGRHLWTSAEWINKHQKLHAYNTVPKPKAGWCLGIRSSPLRKKKILQAKINPPTIRPEMHHCGRGSKSKQLWRQVTQGYHLSLWWSLWGPGHLLNLLSLGFFSYHTRIVTHIALCHCEE